MENAVNNFYYSSFLFSIFFSCKKTWIQNQLIKENKHLIEYSALATNDNVSKISVIGVGMKSQSGVAQKMFQTLASKQINILAISTSEIKISVLIEKRYAEEAVKSLHAAYKLS